MVSDKEIMKVPSAVSVSESNVGDFLVLTFNL